LKYQKQTLTNKIYKMKKSGKIALASFALSCIAFTNVQAQSTISRQPTFGIKGGMNFSTLFSDDNANEDNMLTGFNAGLFAKFPISDQVAIQPEVYYTTKGAKMTYDGLIDGESKFKLNYIEVPVLAVINLTDHFNVHAGPYAAYMVSGKISNDTNVGSSDTDLDTNDFKRFEAGIAAGVGVDLEVLSFGVRYNYGLTKVGKERTIGASTVTLPDAKNGTINAYVGFALN
jgi:hypothetical protein